MERGHTEQLRSLLRQTCGQPQDTREAEGCRIAVGWGGLQDLERELALERDDPRERAEQVVMHLEIVRGRPRRGAEGAACIIALAT